MLYLRKEVKINVQIKYISSKRRKDIQSVLLIVFENTNSFLAI